jgi:DNA-binding CsgD family transcriptional regulator
MAQGHTAVTAATVLGISPNTVKSHLAALYTRTHSRNRAHALVRVHALWPHVLADVPAGEVLFPLTDTELELLTRLGEGRTAVVAGRPLNMDIHVTREHLGLCYRKLGSANIVQALHTAIRAGLLDPARVIR